MDDAARKVDQIWANEGGIMVRFQRGSKYREADVVISIIRQEDDTVLASATLTGWRWDRAVKAMQADG